MRAAGGIVTRPAPSGAIEVLLVHRPRYDDWTFPKGRVDDGESDEEAALREVREETGLDCVLGDPVGSIEFLHPNGEWKVVTYWRMTPTGGSFEENDEVDRVEWLPVPDAIERLSYESDRELLERVASSK